MNATPSAAPPGWFRVVSILLLLWNLFGIFMFYTQYTMTPTQIGALTPEQQQLWNNMPAWMWVVYGAAVFAGALGALLLLLRKRASLALFWVSLVAIVVQFAQVFFPGGALELMGPAMALPMPAFIAAVAIVQVWLARKAIARGWVS